MQKILGNKSLLFIVSAPGGTGKTTLVEKLKKEFSCIAQSISYTTRTPRKDEINGKDYFFISQKEFEEKINNDEFLEYEKVLDNYYGTSKKFLEENKDKHIILVIDTKGAKKLIEKNLAISIFIMPPDLETLKKRLLKRNQDSIEIIEKKLAYAKKEILDAKYYNYIIINDDLNIAYQILRSVLIASERRGKYVNLSYK